MKEISAENREKGTALANDICKNHRREGLYFDDIEDLKEIHQQRKKHK